MGNVRSLESLTNLVTWSLKSTSPRGNNQREPRKSCPFQRGWSFSRDTFSILHIASTFLVLGVATQMALGAQL